jgi:hypothetical protein
MNKIFTNKITKMLITPQAILCQQKFHFHIHKCYKLAPILRQVNQFQYFQFHFLQLQFNTEW